LGHRDLAIRLEVELRGRRGVQFDFRRSADQTPGSVNANRAVTLAAAIYSVRCLCSGRVPTNGGLFRPLHLITRPGSLLDPHRPAAVVGGNVETSQRIVDVCMQALRGAAPDRIPAASAGTMSNFAFGGLHPQTGAGFTFYETIPGGSGAGPGGHGTAAIQTHMTNTRNTPIEDLERRFPVRVLRTEFRTGSGGRGANVGGDGLVREIEFLTAGQVSLLGERRRTGPPGTAGGKPGRPGRDQLRRNGRLRRMPAKCSFAVVAGDVVRIETPGGGGYGVRRSRRRRSTPRSRR
jgi:N-methylhydantoinase B